jgi:hypothetical protein
MFFGVLQIRKVQEARDPNLAAARPATTVVVYDAVKTRMDEALERARSYVSHLLMVDFSATEEWIISGLIPGEDAPDIVANTFLDQVTAQQLEDIGLGFLEHRECRFVF